MRALFLALCLSATVLPASAWSQECDPKDESQTGMTACAAASYKTADDRLNKAYAKVRAAFSDDEEGRKLLVAAQRAWMAFRDAECAFSVNDSKGGSIYPMLMSECLEGLTNDRTKQLEADAACEEGDMSCPAPSAQ